ncbi:hypothetical protein BJ508DRAFT_167091 [Ascobolus immersus RN42]|uniref:Uncharacterized protein n=1 Tax=Ascobolus immersus RN42 TaxID=1160509 RepID=A0A3N4IVT8_ASCIM|nr:hypothetical protein BJ508DRAFT_167091 [Ascobolus immersus RN42]
MSRLGLHHTASSQNTQWASVGQTPTFLKRKDVTLGSGSCAGESRRNTDLISLKPGICCLNSSTDTYGHRLKNIRDPVRSPIVKLLIAKLVLRWVTTRESLVLYVLLL